MGITYTIDTEHGVVLERWAGPVTADDVAEYWTWLTTSPEVAACGKTLADVREVDLQLSGEDLMHLVKTILAPAFAERRLKTAILVDRPYQFGVARQYQVFAETYSENQIFTDEAKARAWIGL